MPSDRYRRGSKQKAPNRRVAFTLESTLESVNRAEAAVLPLCKSAGYGKRQREEIALAVRESVVNAVLHGNRCDTKKKVILKAELKKLGLVISVKDEGGGFDPSTLPDPLSPENLLQEPGRGVFLVKALMDEVKLRRGASCGMEVTMIKYLSKTALRRTSK